MRKLLQINVTANWGSTGKIAEQIGQTAIANGWKSYIAYSRYANDSYSKLIKIGGTLSIYWHVLIARLFDMAGLGSILTTIRLIKQIIAIEPDIVHLHNIHGYYINYKILFRYLNSTNIKVVWTFHDCWAFTGHCAHFVNAGCEKWKTGCFKCPLIKEYPKSLCFDRSLQNYQDKRKYFSSCNNLTVVPVSEWIGVYAKESFFRGKVYNTIHNGVDLDLFTPSKESHLDNSIFRILAVSSVWNEAKGLLDLFKLSEILPEDYKITIVGLNEKQIKLLPKRIVGIRRTQDLQELVSLYSSADVFVNPSYADTFPTVNLEALACGTPVVTYNTGGSPEAITAETGVVVPQGDIKALANAIVKMRYNPLSSSACRKHAEQTFDKNKCFDKYMDLYDKLCEK